jgi:RNA polymerase sigma factor (sigma-70 family)
MQAFVEYSLPRDEDVKLNKKQRKMFDSVVRLAYWLVRPTELGNDKRPKRIIRTIDKLKEFGFDQDTLNQVALISAMKACKRWRKEYKTKITTLAVKFVETGLLNAMSKNDANEKRSRRNFHFDRLVLKEYVFCLHDYRRTGPEWEEVESVLDSVLASMTDKQRDIFTARYGVGRPKETLSKIAERYGVSKEAIRIYQRAWTEKFADRMREEENGQG